MTFEECDRRQCFDIEIIDDQKLEKKESLFVLLKKTAHLDSRLELERVTSTVVITDTDSRDLCVSIPVQLLIERYLCGMTVTIEFCYHSLSRGYCAVGE